MDGWKQIYLLLIYQGFYLGSVCQEWTFPTKITGVIGSCVEIPCTYHPDKSSGTSSTVWYLYARRSYPEILNTGDSSSVMVEYRDRTSLVPGENSCSLRIDPVREGDGGKYYYPGITEDKYINAYDKHSRSVSLDITDTLNVQLYVPEVMAEEEAAIIRCTAEHTCFSSPPSLQWNKPGQIQKKSVEISKENIFWREESELNYIPLYVDDGSPVVCTATYPNGQKIETSKTMNITYTPKNVTVTIIGMNDMIEESDVTLQCNSFSKPDAFVYEWYKGKTKLSDRGRKITVRKVTRDMEPYSCVAINHLGSGKSAPTKIPVQYAAMGVHINVKKEHGFSELTCDFLSSRPDVTHYTWMKNGSILQDETEKTLTIHSNEESYELYACIAHNNAGNSSSGDIYFNDEESMESFIQKYIYIILLATIGTICLLLIPLLVYACRRKRQKKPTRIEPEEATYTDLRKSDITNIYHEMKPVIPADTTVKSDKDDANENEYV